MVLQKYAKPFFYSLAFKDSFISILTIFFFKIIVTMKVNIITIIGVKIQTNILVSLNLPNPKNSKTI